MSEERKIVRVSAESEKAIREYAEQKEIGNGEAVDALIATGVSRLKALAKYSAQKRPQAPGKPRAKKAAAKKAPAKKAPAKKAAAKKAPAKPVAKKTAPRQAVKPGPAAVRSEPVVELDDE